MSSPLVVVVTGANRGIGLAICNQILQLPHQHPLHLYAASRAGADLSLSTPSSSSSSSNKTSIHYPSLDITSTNSISSFLATLSADTNHIDVLINNAGINTTPDHSPAAAKKTLDTNYRGTMAITQSLLPFLAATKAETGRTARVVNVSSVGSQLHIYSEAVAQRFRNPEMTFQELESMAAEYEGIVSEGREKAMGWGGRGQAYSVSKACVNAFTAILAREQGRDGDGGVLFNACCPGWVDTDMGGLVGKPPKSVDDGAKIPVRLGFGDIGGVTGRYWANPSVFDKGEGDVVDW